MKKRVSTKHNLLYERLEHEVAKRNSFDELCVEKPDPLWIATLYKDEFIALICALFAYGNARSIVKFLQTLDFSLSQSLVFFVCRLSCCFFPLAIAICTLAIPL